MLATPVERLTEFEHGGGAFGRQSTVRAVPGDAEFAPETAGRSFEKLRQAPVDAALLDRRHLADQHSGQRRFSNQQPLAEFVPIGRHHSSLL